MFKVIGIDISQAILYDLIELTNRVSPRFFHRALPGRKLYFHKRSGKALPIKR